MNEYWGLLAFAVVLLGGIGVLTRLLRPKDRNADAVRGDNLSHSPSGSRNPTDYLD